MDPVGALEVTRNGVLTLVTLTLAAATPETVCGDLNPAELDTMVAIGAVLVGGSAVLVYTGAASLRRLLRNS